MAPRRRLRAAAALLLALLAPPPGAPLTQPHIVFIIADDLGHNDVRFLQNRASGANPRGLPTATHEYLTPTLDALVAESARLDSYYVQPLCSPTRGAMLTGRYPSHTGIGPDVDLEPSPYGMPGDETFLPERLRAAGYRNHLVGKHHLGYCDPRYEPTFRGFDSFVGYMEGATDYYAHAGDWRNSSAAGVAGECSGASVQGQYSASLFTAEVDRIVRAHDASGPLFLWVALQNVHNPYEPPPPWVVDVNVTYANISSYAQRTYAGMVTALDLAVANVTRSLQAAGLWDDTVLVFVTDNGGIAYGNNYPLRGAKVYNYEGGVRGVGFVRGTNSALAPVPAGVVRTQLLHATDWFATVCRLAGVAPDTRYPLDGLDVWDTIARGAPSPRTSIVHNAPIGRPVANGSMWTTGACMSGVDPAVGGFGGCHAFGVTGAALRLGDFKLLVTHNGSAPWGDSSPAGMPQYVPFEFTPTTNDSIPEAFRGAYFLFNISADPTETTNLAGAMPGKLQELLDFYAAYAETAVPDLSWRWGFDDPTWLHNGGCQGPFNGSRYCWYGHERGCFVRGSGLEGLDVGVADGATPEACQAACAATSGCAFFVLREAEQQCRLKSGRGAAYECADCSWGPARCPV